MAAANAAWQGYQTVQSVRDLAGGRKNIGEIDISISYRQQKNRSEVRSDLSRVQESRINAGGKDQDSQSSTTRSGIGTRNIQITDAAEQQRRNGQSGQQAAAGIYTDRRSETADATAGYLKNGFDRERVEKELALQQSVTRQFAPVAAQQIANVSDYLGNTRNYQMVAGLIGHGMFFEG